MSLGGIFCTRDILFPKWHFIGFEDLVLPGLAEHHSVLNCGEAKDEVTAGKPQGGLLYDSLPPMVHACGSWKPVSVN